MHVLVLELWFKFKLGTMHVEQVASNVKFETIVVYGFMVHLWCQIIW